jgi:hypothetical protein
VGREWPEQRLPVSGPGDLPDVIPSAVDPDVECVRVATAGGAAKLIPPDEEPVPDANGSQPCPEGYVPRRRRRPPYELEGKIIRPPG